MAAKPEIDPYDLWLGIPSAEQPPNHYRLLGVTLFEANAEVIDAAAFRRNKHLRAFALGPHSDHSQKLLNEVAAAKICLSKPERKAAYDAELRARMAAPATGRVEPVTPVAATSKPAAAIEPLPAPPPIRFKAAARPTNTLKTTFDIEPLPPPGPLSASPRLPTLRRNTNRAKRAKPVAWQWFAVGGAVVAVSMLGLALFRDFDPGDGSSANVVALNQRDSIPAFQPHRPAPSAVGPPASAPGFSAPTPSGVPLPFGMAPAASPSAAPSLSPPRAAPPPAIAPFSADQAKRHQQAWAAHLGVPVEYENTIGMKFVLIPPGEFLMGSTPAEVQAEIQFGTGGQFRIDSIRNEAPQHKVILTRAVYLGVHEVTRKQFEAVNGDSKRLFGPARPALHPACGFSWNDVVDFCARLSEQEGLPSSSSLNAAAESPYERQGYRLPTEAEWEFACRAGTTTRYWNGDRDDQLSLVAWFGSNAASRAHSVGELNANPFGLFDVHGNVSEWVQDWWAPDYYRQFQGAPAIDPSGPASGSERVVRGGDHIHFAIDCRASSREPKELSRHSVVGVRVALSVESVRAAIAGGKNRPTTATAGAHVWPVDAPPPARAPFSADQARRSQQDWASHLHVPVAFENSIGMKFALIPPGEFQMGSTQAEVDALVAAINRTDLRAPLRAACPLHKVILPQAVYMSVCEVTQEQYMRVMGKNPSHFATTGAGKKAVMGLDTSNHPVEMVSWRDVADFCKKLSLMEDRSPIDFESPASKHSTQERAGYRLPSEAEWEFACRAGTTTRFWSGDREEQLAQVERLTANLNGRTHAVGGLKPNPFGLFDLHGNVREWVHDYWDPDYYTQFRHEVAVDPVNDRYSIDLHIARVARGGCSLSAPYLAQSTYREGANGSSGGNFTGFRIALDVSGSREDR